MTADNSRGYVFERSSDDEVRRPCQCRHCYLPPIDPPCDDEEPLSWLGDSPKPPPDRSTSD